jgi:hypothetical protein
MNKDRDSSIQSLEYSPLQQLIWHVTPRSPCGRGAGGEGEKECLNSTCKTGKKLNNCVLPPVFFDQIVKFLTI